MAVPRGGLCHGEKPCREGLAGVGMGLGRKVTAAVLRHSVFFSTGTPEVQSLAAGFLAGMAGKLAMIGDALSVLLWRRPGG